MCSYMRLPMAWWVILIHYRNLAELGRFRGPSDFGGNCGVAGSRIDDARSMHLGACWRAIRVFSMPPVAFVARAGVPMGS